VSQIFGFRKYLYIQWRQFILLGQLDLNLYGNCHGLIATSKPQLAVHMYI